MSASLAVVIVIFATALCGTIDARTGLIPNRMTYSVFLVLITIATLRGEIGAALLGTGSVAGALGLLLILTRGRGLGLGDVKLGASIGAGLGAKLGLVAIGSAFVFGGALGIALLASGRATRKDAIRFGPFLALGSLAAIVGHAYGWNPLG